MDDQVLSKRVKTLNKAAAAAEPPSVVIALLEELKNAKAPTEEQLRSTKAGVAVGKLRHNANKEIARLASEIVSKWRKNVDAAKESKKRKLEQSKVEQSESPTPKDSPAPPSTSYSTPYEGDPEKRHFRTDKVDISRTGNKVRDGSIGVLYNGLAYRATESIEEVLQRTMEVEAAAYAAYGDTNEYRTKIRGLMTSLKRKDNPELGRRVLRGDIAPDKFAVMTDEELASDAQRERDAALERENMLKAQVPMAQRSISDSLQCGKCKQKKVSYSQAQTRSADEPMTTFCECTVCGHRWKFS
ncbi:transcription factor S-II, central domain-containing protein [Chaetomium tenue]|uniref:Transcription factor S-II, central domain-containing protein n=1 Tax=Chaetomium tenue TaxID=1854479 RepID=A0ACB7PLK0_9PEZI|nr:transcription factor S-II, central domain-containing protein [Chaetomium globosum]